MSTYRIPVQNLDTGEVVLMEVESSNRADAQHSALHEAFSVLRWSRSKVALTSELPDPVTGEPE